MKNSIPRSPGVYQILNKINNKFYIGSSKNLRQRKWDHYKLLKTNCHPNSYLQNAWNKYGENSFDFIVLTVCNISDILDIEQQYIDTLKPHLRDIGYNISPTAYNTLGTKWTEARHALGNPGRKGKPISQEHKQAISKALKGVPLRDETKLKLSHKASNRSATHQQKLNESHSGSKSRLAKLTEEDIKNIRSSYPTVSMNKLANLYAVNQSTISRIVNNKRWKYL